MPIPEIKITGTQISEIKIPDVMQQLPQVPTAIPVYPPVTSTVGVPIINIPGCVEAHEQNSSKEKSGVLSEDDPKGVVTYCDAGIPSFNPIDYNKDKLKFEYEAPIPKVRPPETPDVETPEVPKNAAPKDKYECPGPNAPRIGDVAQNQKERVSGYETRIINNEQVCVTLYEDIPLTSQYLPAPQVVATTAAIACCCNDFRTARKTACRSSSENCETCCEEGDCCCEEEDSWEGTSSPECKGPPR